MKNIHILPTDKPSRLFLNKKNNTLFINEQFDESSPKIIALNIYITSDKKIKVGDWVLYTGGNRIHCQKLEDKNDVELANIEDSGAFKIILTTDQDLIKDGVQAIDDEFLEWFVKNPSCEKVEVKTWIKTYEDGSTFDRMDYKIIIPKEEDKQVCENYKREISKWGCACGIQIKPKQETLEETAEKYANQFIDGRDDYYGFIEGAKWQQEKSYNDEEVKHIVSEALQSALATVDLDQFLQQFKKKIRWKLNS